MHDRLNGMDPSKIAASSFGSGTQGHAHHDLSHLTAFSRTGQVITLALANGILVIAVIFGFMMMNNEATANAIVLLSIGGGVSAVSLVVAFLVPKMIRSQAASQLRQSADGIDLRNGVGLNAPSAEQLQRWGEWQRQSPAPTALRSFLNQDQTATLIGQAILEGSAVINLVFAFLDGSWLHFAFVLVAFVALVSTLPTNGKLNHRIESALGAG
ncbi:hypothetical protein [Neorhodopirellula lusitana]|uniref:hypothetical protein n=1 Tax=Neorhodopirellula lusitana TaxID=445327 RepID=UPI00384BFEB8